LETYFTLYHLYDQNRGGAQNYSETTVTRFI
jgi:hypothetical protein